MEPAGVRPPDAHEQFDQDKLRGCSESRNGSPSGAMSRSSMTWIPVRQNLRAALKKLASCLAETGSTEGAATTTGRTPDERQWPCT